MPITGIDYTVFVVLVLTSLALNVFLIGYIAVEALRAARKRIAKS